MDNFILLIIGVIDFLPMKSIKIWNDWYICTILSDLISYVISDFM